MTESQKEQRIKSFNRNDGICPVCGGSIQQYGTPQYAHKIANTIINRKKWGSFIVDHPLNGEYTCSLGCNSRMNIGQRPGDCLRLIKKIVEMELKNYGEN